MGHPGPEFDETVVADVNKTKRVPNTRATDAVSLAWSRNADKGHDDDDGDAAPGADRQSWRSTWRIAGALVAGGLVLAGAIVLGRWILAPGQTPSQAGQPSSTEAPAEGQSAVASPHPTASEAAPSSITSTPDQDKKYLQALNDRGISFADPDAAITNGKVVCQNLHQGMTRQQIADEFRASTPRLSDSADDYVAISINSYCP